MIVFGYIYIFIRMSAYHKGILEKFSRLYSSEEISRIQKTTNEIRLFFSYICVNLMMQQLYLVSKWFVEYDEQSDYSKRSVDIIKIFLLTTSIFMNYGISRSIKRAFSAQ